MSLTKLKSLDGAHKRLLKIELLVVATYADTKADDKYIHRLRKVLYRSEKSSELKSQMGIWRVGRNSDILCTMFS